jgi:hypothetical protein
VGAGARSGGGGEKISGVVGTRGTGAAAESDAAEAGSGAAVPAKSWVPGITAIRAAPKATLAREALAREARLLRPALILGGVPVF